MNSKPTAIIHRALRNDVWVIALSCALFLMIEVPLLTDGRPLTVDEAWYSNPAYNFAQGQWIHNTNVGSGGDMNFVFPFVQGVLFKLFGYSIFSARFASVLAGMLSIWVLFKIVKQLKIPNNAAILSLFALIAIPAYHSVFRYARPESWAILLVLLSLLYAIRYIHAFSLKDVMASGIFCGLGFLTHPYTLSVSLVIGLFLLIHSIRNKKILVLFVFAIPVLLSITAFFLNYTYLLAYSKPLVLFGRVNTVNAGYLNRIGNNLHDILDNFILDKNITYFMPMLFLLFAGLFMKNKNRPAFYSSMAGSLVFVIALVFFSSGGFEIPMFYVFIFSLLNFAFMRNGISKQSSLLAIYLFLFLMLCGNIYYDVNRYEPLNSMLEKKLPKIVADNATVIGPTAFWMFLPKTQFKSTGYRWGAGTDLKRLPLEFDYFLSSSRDGNTIYKNVRDTNRLFMAYPGLKLIYETHSKHYGKIGLYSLENRNDPL